MEIGLARVSTFVDTAPWHYSLENLDAHTTTLSLRLVIVVN